jgi:hypothetical protein
MGFVLGQKHHPRQEGVHPLRLDLHPRPWLALSQLLKETTTMKLIKKVDHYSFLLVSSATLLVLDILLGLLSKRKYSDLRAESKLFLNACLQRIKQS